MDIIVRLQGLCVAAWLAHFFRASMRSATGFDVPGVVSARVSLRRRGAGDVACEIVSCRENRPRAAA